MPQRVISQKPTAETGQAIETRVTVERALTIFLNSQEIVTAMTINGYPEYLALGYLLARSVAAPIANRELQKSNGGGRKCGQLFLVEREGGQGSMKYAPTCSART